MLNNLLIELQVEELPPKALKKLGQAFANTLLGELKTHGLASDSSVLTSFATPRRLAAHITEVAAVAKDKPVSQKLMPASVALADGKPSAALLKKLQALSVAEADLGGAVAALKTVHDGKADVLFYDSMAKGLSLAEGLQKALDTTLAKLPIPKVMEYQLADGWTSVSFVRPAHGLMALHGSQVVAVQALGLNAGSSTQGHRFEAKAQPVQIAHADQYEQALEQDGAVVASYDKRRALIVAQLQAAAQKASTTAGVALHAIDDADLLDEVNSLVERPHVLLCEFEKEYLSVPQECLILTMKANQKYFPLLTADGKLANQFLLVSNITPDDATAVIDGNERVVRPRLADAKFFFDQDRKKTLESRLPQLTKVVYHNQLGTQAERSERVRQITHIVVQQLGDAQAHYSVELKNELDMLAVKADQAARLAKADLLTDMVGEFPELQGIMGGYYARHEGLKDGVAIAIEDHYKPRFSGDSLPRNHTGLVVALADKLETLVGMFGIGNVPTGDKDPFALRRHALGVIRILLEKDLALNLHKLLQHVISVFGGLIADAAATETALTHFFYERLGGLLREQGFSSQEVDAVLAQNPERFNDVVKRLQAVRSFTALPEAAALAAANKRVNNILKKNEAELKGDTQVERALLQAPEEIAVFDKMESLLPEAERLLAAHDYAGQLKLAAGLREVVDAFFDKVMVMAEDPVLRQQRLALLVGLQWHMNQVADISKLAA